jgi:hypothetical protein
VNARFEVLICVHACAQWSIAGVDCNILLTEFANNPNTSVPLITNATMGAASVNVSVSATTLACETIASTSSVDG